MSAAIGAAFIIIFWTTVYFGFTRLLTKLIDLAILKAINRALTPNKGS